MLTVAVRLPAERELKLVNHNVEKLDEKQLYIADYVLNIAINVQRKLVLEVILKYKMKGKKICAGGPLFASDYADFDNVDYLVLNEAELILPEFLS